eukprot:CAMPEP_0172441662 /NCGR_PEP_ID=MMETSP1065-20121228/2169_1 /TAXON_ID=265537 /ORGANISM="Amphiprora paludosa, Strain CCMP125" /LENGTH=242 /DNA_ID=CAMNT_0013191123 /DNA_START=96 /DNA_END=824 /DNA_ORIENTATION=-
MQGSASGGMYNSSMHQAVGAGVAPTAPQHQTLHPAPTQFSTAPAPVAEGAFPPFSSPEMGVSTPMFVTQSMGDPSVKRGRHDYSEESDAESYYNNMTVVTMEPGDASVRSGSQEESWETSSKRTRPNNYITPTEIPKTLISTMGSLVVPPPFPLGGAGALSSSLGSSTASTFGSSWRSSASSQNQSINGSATSGASRHVHLRRQLSGSRIESFFMGGSAADAANKQDTVMDVEPSRPRSMSL